MNDEDALLQQAPAMSMAEAASGGGEEEKTSEDMDTTDTGGDAEDEDAAMQMALAMFMGEGGDAEGGQQFQDPAFVNQVSYRCWYICSEFCMIAPSLLMIC